MKLDRKDRAILELLQKNARQSATDIGRNIGLSRTSVQDRINKLERAGTIRGYRAILTQEQESVNALIFLKFATSPCDSVLDWLVTLKTEGIQEIFSLSGIWDAAIRISLPTTNDMSELIDRIDAHEFVADSTSQVILKSL